MNYEQSISRVNAAQSAYERTWFSCATDDEVAAALQELREVKQAHVRQFGPLRRYAGVWC